MGPSGSIGAASSVLEVGATWQVPPLPPFRGAGVAGGARRQPGPGVAEELPQGGAGELAAMCRCAEMLLINGLARRRR